MPDDAPLGMSVPVAVGLSLSDYYEANGQDNSFGFFSVGLMARIPLSGVPAGYGSWELAGCIQFLVFGDGLEAINGNVEMGIRRGIRIRRRMPEPLVS